PSPPRRHTHPLLCFLCRKQRYHNLFSCFLFFFSSSSPSSPLLLPDTPHLLTAAHAAAILFFFFFFLFFFFFSPNAPHVSSVSTCRKQRCCSPSCCHLSLLSLFPLFSLFFSFSSSPLPFSSPRPHTSSLQPCRSYLLLLLL
ncbi:unnamed protein product, partial [Musa acuminata subsp. burmannicoides]